VIGIIVLDTHHIFILSMDISGRELFVASAATRSRFVEMMPRTTVVHLRRKDGKIVQGCDVYIGRACYKGGWTLPASKWGNPYTTAEYGSIDEVLKLYEARVMNTPTLLASLPELKGKVLGCWCKPKPCHGDVLARLANNLSA
jgi:hypothetical protein